MKQLTFKLEPGQLLKEEIASKAKNIKAGVLLSTVGALQNARLRMPGATPKNQKIKNIKGPLEIVSGIGTISKEGCHIHISVSDKNGKVTGGHLKEGSRVGITAEIVIGIFNDIIYKRTMNPKSGFKELDVIKSMKHP